MNQRTPALNSSRCSINDVIITNEHVEVTKVVKIIQNIQREFSEISHSAYQCSHLALVIHISLLLHHFVRSCNRCQMARVHMQAPGALALMTSRQHNSCCSCLGERQKWLEKAQVLENSNGIT